MDWRVAGEGNANMVLTYTGASTALQGCALRVPKHLPLKNSAQELLQADRPLRHIIEETIWGDVLPSVHKLMVEQHPSHEPIGHAHALMLRQMMYIKRVLKPLMGACYAQSGVPVKLPSEAAVVLKGCGVPAEAGQPAMLLNDATSLASVAKVLKHKDLMASLTGPVLCMELKPKWGFLPSTKHMSEPAAHVNGVVPRFTQHQLLKTMMHNGSTRTSKIQSPSDDFQNTDPTTCSTMDELDALGFSHYNPLDLFSGEESRMLKSLRALIQVPGNNLRMFLDGRLLLGGRPHAASQSSVYSASTTASAGASSASGTQQGPSFNYGATSGTQEKLSAPNKTILSEAAEALNTKSILSEAAEALNTKSILSEAAEALFAARNREEHGHHGYYESSSTTLSVADEGLQQLLRMLCAVLKHDGLLDRLKLTQQLQDESGGIEGAALLYQELLRNMTQTRIDEAGHNPALRGSHHATSRMTMKDGGIVPKESGAHSTNYSNTISTPEGDSQGCCLVTCEGEAMEEELGTIGPSSAVGAHNEADVMMSSSHKDTELGCWSHSQKMAALRAFLTSATAKDCGIMICIQRCSFIEQLPQTDTERSGHAVKDDEAGNAERAPIHEPCVQKEGQQHMVLHHEGLSSATLHHLASSTSSWPQLCKHVAMNSNLVGVANDDDKEEIIVLPLFEGTAPRSQLSSVVLDPAASSVVLDPATSAEADDNTRSEATFKVPRHLLMEVEEGAALLDPPSTLLLLIKSKGHVGHGHSVIDPPRPSTLYSRALFAVQVSLVDLDPKPSEKIPGYLSLDQSLVSFSLAHTNLLRALGYDIRIQ